MNCFALLPEGTLLLIALVSLGGSFAGIWIWLALVLHAWDESRRNKGPTE